MIDGFIKGFNETFAPSAQVMGWLVGLVAPWAIVVIAIIILIFVAMIIWGLFEATMDWLSKKR